MTRSVDRSSQATCRACVCRSAVEVMVATIKIDAKLMVVAHVKAPGLGVVVIVFSCESCVELLKRAVAADVKAILVV